MYEYEVKEVRHVIDGDTVDLVVDVGFYMTATIRFRLLGIDTPERNGKDGARALQATIFTASWLTDHAGELRIRTYKADSFGRWLAEVYVTGHDTATLNQALLDNGMAVPMER